MKPILTILIPTKPGREDCCQWLINYLTKQIETGHYPIKIHKLWNDGITKTIGAVRNDMIDECDTEYLLFFDDDDKPSDHYISTLYKGIVDNPGIDAIGFLVDVLNNGRKDGCARISNEYEDWVNNNGPSPYRYHRTINHLAVVKTELARKARFSDKNHGEDYDYAVALKPLLKNVVTINEILYYYFFVPIK